jgi:alkylation response protein AidB-like acyl-CoA dehydrogenase
VTWTLGVAVPEAYGGLGMGFVSTMLVCDYISGATGSSTAFGAHTGIGTANYFVWFGRKQNMFQNFTGEWFGAYLTEPGAGSDANWKTKLFYLKMENTIPSQGKKWISNAGFCRYLSFFARTDENYRFSL